MAITATAPQAQDLMTADQFDAYTRGKTLIFEQDGAPYGAEEYLEGRRVRWSFLDGVCSEGHWYEQEGQICFIYEGEPDPQCWRFFQTDAGVVSLFANDPGSAALYEVHSSPEPLFCAGPRIGV
jgi:hypothetical protein